MPLESGSRLGQYRIDTLLGAGGMGVVYRAFDTRLQRPVAIKLLQHIPGIDAGERLMTEARLASALNHPNICTVYEVAEHGERPFIVMEFVDGRPLSAVLSERPDVGHALELAVQIAAALAHAHDRGVAHGDLKSGNVLVADGDRIKVVDFGLGRRHTKEETATGSFTMGGTPYAMSPEQLRGARPDARSDIWSFGVLLQELVCRVRPFERPTVPELMAAILREHATPPPATVPPAVRRVLDRCLARDPSRRYQRAGEVLAALEAISDVGRAVQVPASVEVDLVIPPPPALALAAAHQVPLIGRDAERQALGAAWQRAAAGRRQLALVAGDPGIGKTRLVTDFARSVADGATVLLGRCDQEALLPHQPFVEALEWYARACPQAALEQHLADVDGQWELAQLIPAIGRRAPIAAAPVESNPEGRRYRLFEGVAALLSAIARTRPLLIVLEDLHWADRATLMLLRHLLRSSHEARVCLAATYRETDVGRGHPLADVLAELRREEGVERIVLRGLAEEQVRQFIGCWMAGDSPTTLTRLVAENTEGNPFFISEVLRHLSDTGVLRRVGGDAAGPSREDLGLPEGVREAIRRRLSRLGEVANRLLTLAAVVGREFDLTLLQALSELPEEQVLDALDEALEARLVVDVPAHPGRFAFTHALVRDTLYEELTAVRRSRVHRSVAQALERLAPPEDLPCADLAYHYARATSAADAGKAIDYAVRAAERAAASFALEEAARFYEVALHALDLVPGHTAHGLGRFDLRFRRGRAFADLGQWAPARVEFEAALELVDPADPLRRAELVLELSKCAFWLLDTVNARRYGADALALAESLGRDDLAADAMAWIAGVMNAEGDVLGAVELDRRSMARVGGPRTFGLARTVISLYHLGLLDEAIERAQQAVDSARVTRDPTFQVYALEHLAVSLTGAGRYAEAARTFQEMRETGRRFGALPMLARGLAMTTGIYVALGDYARAEAAAADARDLARRLAFPPPEVSAGLDLLFIYARTHEPGRADTLMPEVAQAVVAASGWHGWLWRLRLSQARAELAAARGDWLAAVDFATEGIAESHARSRRKYEVLGYVTRARARWTLGEARAAAEDAARGVALARVLADPAVLLTALGAQLDIAGSDEILSEARACVVRILAHVEEPQLRERFLAHAAASSAARVT
jgi:tetratricopeptide (TPR) repeat protein/predicted Ser/Thr protein kinase